MIIDAHHHLWASADGYGWLHTPGLAPLRRPFTLDDLRPELRAAGVDRTVLVEAGRCHPDEAGEHLAVAAGAGEIAGVVCWLDLTGPDVAGTLAAYRDLPGAGKLVGVRDQVQGRDDPEFLASGEARRGLAAVRAAGLAFDLVVRVDQIGAIGAAAAAEPDLPLVLDHLGKPRIAAGAAGLAQWRAALAPVAAAPNLAAKLSGLVSEADRDRWTVADLRPFVHAAVELFGPDRLMFGSDWPVCTTAAGYSRVLSALREALPELSAAESAAVFGGTAARVYRLEV